MENCSLLVDEMVTYITDIYQLLKQQKDLSPKNQLVENTLIQLRNYILLPHTESVVKQALEILSSQTIVEKLRGLYQKAEYEVEAHYTRSSQLYMNFPYLYDYLGLCLVETELANINENSSIAFIGCGPFPCTILVLAVIQAIKDRKKLDYLKQLWENGEKAEVVDFMRNDFWADWAMPDIPFRAVAIEREVEAARLAIDVIDKLGFANYIDVRNCDGRNFSIPKECQIVYIASMVEDKKAVITNLMNKMTPGQEVNFIVRSADSTGLRSLLYEPADNLLETMESDIPTLQRVKSFFPEAGSRLRHSIHVYKYVHSTVPSNEPVSFPSAVAVAV